jgi:hypothetical protein
MLAVAALTLVVAGCGGQQFPQSGDPQANATDPAAARELQARLLSAVHRTSALGTARLAISMKLLGTSDESMSVSGSGVIDFVRNEASLAVRGDDNGQPVTLDLRFVRGTVYTRSGGDWMSAPGGAADINMPNPVSYLSYLQGVSSDVRVAGHETLRGVETTRYSANIDFDRALAHSTNPTQRNLFAQALTMLGGLRMPIVVWIDGDGHLRKVQLSLDLGAALRNSGLPTTGAPKIEVALELYDFGAPVHVVAPAGSVDTDALSRIRAVQRDLRNALTAEKTLYVDNQAYSAAASALKQIELSLDWGGKLQVVVGDAAGMRDAVVCLSESAGDGRVFSIADVASGPKAGTYYGRTPCPSAVRDVSVARLGSRW